MNSIFTQNCIELQPSGCREETVSFAGVRGELHGILSRPPARMSVRGGIIFSHGWSGSRNGPADLLRFLARQFAARGWICLRFDFSGRGESPGPGLETSLVTMGDDLTAAADWFRRNPRVGAPVICGLCSGGNVAVGSLNRLPELSGLLLLSVYPFSDGDCFQREIHRTWHFLGVYLRKACSPGTWRRLFQGQVSPRNVLRVLFGHWMNRKKNQAKETGNKASAAPGRSARAASHESRNAGAGQIAPQEHLRKLRPDLPVLMVYGSADPDAAAAGKYFGDYALRRGLPLSFRTVEKANHNFSSRIWRLELTEMLADFLDSLQEQKP